MVVDHDNYKLSHGRQLYARMTIFDNYVLQWWKFRQKKNSSFFCDGNSNNSSDDVYGFSFLLQCSSITYSTCFELLGNMEDSFVDIMLLWERIWIMAVENYGNYYYMESHKEMEENKTRVAKWVREEEKKKMEEEQGGNVHENNCD
jgi:hypothetical protein